MLGEINISYSPCDNHTSIACCYDKIDFISDILVPGTSTETSSTEENNPNDAGSTTNCHILEEKAALTSGLGFT